MDEETLKALDDWAKEMKAQEPKLNRSQKLKKRVRRWWDVSSFSPRVIHVTWHNRVHDLKYRMKKPDGSASADIGGWYLVHFKCPKCKEDGSGMSKTPDGRITGFWSGGEYTDGHELLPHWDCPACGAIFWVHWQATLSEREPDAIEKNKKADDKLQKIFGDGGFEIDIADGPEETRRKIQEKLEED